MVNRKEQVSGGGGGIEYYLSYVGYAFIIPDMQYQEPYLQVDLQFRPMLA